MKTLFLFQEIPERSFFFQLEGDYSHLHGAFINGTGTSKEAADELLALVYRTASETDAFKAANPKVKDNDKIYLKVQILQAPTKDWDHFVECGMML